MADSSLKYLYLESGSLKVPNQAHCQDFTHPCRRHKGYYQANTRGWIIHKTDYCLSQAEQNNDEKKLVMWLSANAGMGKSVITAILLDRYIQRDMLGAWHFCVHSNPSENTVLAIILSLSGMLEVTIPGYAEALHAQGDAVLQEAKSKADPMELFETFFLIPLSKINPPRDCDGKLKRMIVFLDALDEMILKEMSGMLAILRDGVPELPSFLLFFVTSRRNDNILSALSAKHELIELRVDSNEQQNDILVSIYKIVQEYVNVDFSWNDLEQKVESKFKLPEGSLKGKLQQLEAPLVSSKRVYAKVLADERINDPNFDEMVNSIPLIKSPKHKLKQPSDDLDITYEQAGLVQDVMGKRLKEGWGNAAVIPGLKKRADAEQKIKDKYFGHNDEIKDVSRFSGKFPSFEALLVGLKFVLKMKGIDVLNVKNKFRNPDVLGYADININAAFELDDGTHHIFEIQLHLDAIIVAKEKVHIFYEDIRKCIPEIVGDSFTVDETNQIKAFVLGRLRNSAVDSAIDILLEKSGGVFLYTRLLEESFAQLAKKFPGSKIDFRSVEALPEGLREFYRTNMDRIFAEGTSNSFRIECFIFISLICAAQEPLTQAMVKQIMGKDAFERVKGKLSLLFPAGAGERINIVHKSLIDWLLRNKDDAVEDHLDIVEYFVSKTGLKKAHEELCSICQKVFVCVPKTDKTQNNNIDLTNMSCSDEANGVVCFDPTAEENVSYAWKHSVVHACEGGESSQLDTVRNDQLLNFHWQLKKIEKLGALQAIRDGELYLKLLPKDRPVRLITHAIQLSAPALEKNWRELASQLLGGRLSMIYESEIFPEIVRVRNDAKNYCLKRGVCAGGNGAGPTSGSLWMPVSPNLTGAGHPCQKILSGHEDSVCAVKLTKEGDRACSGSADGTIKMWEVESGKCLQTLIGHDGPVDAVDMSDDGSVVFSGGDDKTVRSWDSETGVLRFTMEGHTGRVRAVRAAPDGKTVCSGSDDKTVRLWDASTATELKCFTGHTEVVSSVDMTSDGSVIVSGSVDKTIRVWNVASGECTRTLEGDNSDVYAVCLSDNEKSVFSGSHDRTVKMWDINNGELVRSFEGHSACVSSVCVTSDGKWMLSGSYDNTIRKWNIATGECVNTFGGNSDGVTSVSSHNSGIVCSGGMDNIVRIWDSDAKIKVINKTTKGPLWPVLHVRINATGTRLLSDSSRGCTDLDGEYCVWNCETGKCIYEACRLWLIPLWKFNWITARNKSDVSDIADTFDKHDVGFSTDGDLTPKVHFYSNRSSSRVKACVVDSNTIHFLCRV